MNLEQQLTSLELSKRMKELGFPQNSMLWWSRENLTHDFKLSSFARSIEKPENGFKICAYSVAELGELLKKQHYPWPTITSENKFRVNVNGFPVIESENESDARAKMLIYLKENNLIYYPPPLIN